MPNRWSTILLRSRSLAFCAAVAVLAVASCKVREHGKCGKNEDCAQGLTCAENDTCATPASARCISLKPCKTDGWCTSAPGDECVVGGDGDCARSQSCTDFGECTAVDDAKKGRRCGARSNVDCKRSKACVEWGWCTADQGACFPRSQEDCGASAACKNEGRCQVAANQKVCSTQTAGTEHSVVSGSILMGGFFGCCSKPQTPPLQDDIKRTDSMYNAKAYFEGVGGVFK